MDPASESPRPSLPNAHALGFLGSEETGWTRLLRDRAVHFRLLRTLDELTQAESLQQHVFGVSDRDLIPANELIVVAETGGVVIGAFLSEHPERAAGAIVGWGGYLDRPRMVSDFLAVRADARNLGLAAALKRLQAAIALARGFEEIVWTVDPLRAANARLNFGKLGAIATSYEVNRYGSTFAPALYGGMPSDRLHVTWQITSPSTINHLLGRVESSCFWSAPPSPYSPGTDRATTAVTIPTDIDALLARSPEGALHWRHRVRESLVSAFAEGFAITGFLPASGDDPPALVLQRR